MEHVDVLVVGAGPAGLLVGSELARHGLNVAAMDPAAGRASPQSGHVHVLPDETWAAMCSLLPDLDTHVRQQGAPTAPLGAAMLEGPLGKDSRAWPDRRQLDQGLFECAIGKRGLRVVRDRVGPIRWRGSCWHAGCYGARWLVDASGGSRTTLRAAAELASIDWVEWGERCAYASVVLAGIQWPEGRIGHGVRSSDGSGLVLRNIDGQRTLATLQLRGTDDIPPDHADFFDRVAMIAPPGIARWIGRGSPTNAVQVWKSRRSSGVLADDRLEEACWLAVGDALLNSAPHQGQGLSQIMNQIALIRDEMDAGRGLAEAAGRLNDWVEQHMLSTTLSEQLGSPETLGECA